MKKLIILALMLFSFQVFANEVAIKRMAMIQDGVVFNIAVWNGTDAWNPNCELVDVTDKPQVDIGYTYSWGSFSPPEPVESEE